MFLSKILHIYSYIEKKIFDFFKNKTIYEKHEMGNVILTTELTNLIKKNRILLLENQISINKIRFVFTSIFAYDIDTNIIDPKYSILLPINKDNGLFDKLQPIIEINKPKNIIILSVNNYNVEDNYQFIKNITKKTKRGIVIYIDYNISVDFSILRLIDLDEAILLT